MSMLDPFADQCNRDGDDLEDAASDKDTKVGQTPTPPRRSKKKAIAPTIILSSDDEDSLP